MLPASAGGFVAPFTAAEFQAARAGSPATIVAVPDAGWPQSIPTSPLAQWIDANPAGSSALYAVDFQVARTFQNARLTLDFSVDDFLGTATEAGLYINGQPVPGSENIGTYYRVDRYAFDVSTLVQQGLNTLYIYGNNTGGAGGLMFDAAIELDPAALQPYGSGCPGSNGTPLLAPDTGTPRIGGAFSVRAFHLPTNPGVMIMALGDGNTSWVGFPIPVDLGLFGVNGCLGWVDIQDSIPVAHNGGSGVWSANLPTAPGLVGLRFFVQALVADPGATNPARATTSSAIEIWIGA